MLRGLSSRFCLICLIFFNSCLLQSMKIIYITGPCGVGTSTLGETIKRFYDVNLIESDDIAIYPTNPPFQKFRPQEVRHDLLTERLLDYKINVIVGSINEWATDIIEHADMFVFLYAPFSEREPRIQKRERERVGELFEIDEGVKARYKLFIEWTKQYDYFKDPRSFSRHKELYDSFRGIKYFFEHGESIQQIFDTLRNDIEKIIKEV